MTFVINWGTENEIEQKLLYFVAANSLLTFRTLRIVNSFLWFLLFLICHHYLPKVEAKESFLLISPFYSIDGTISYGTIRGITRRNVISGL